LYRWLVPNLALPLYDRLSGRRLWAEVVRLRQVQWRSPEELEAWAVAKLRPLLEHAYVHVPYYRRLFGQAGLQPGDFRAVSDLTRLPVTTKVDLRTNFPAQVVANNLPQQRRLRMTTAGSSGLPLEFYADRAALDVWLGAYFFSLELAGTGIWDTTVLIDSLERISTNRPRPSSAVRALRRVLLGEQTIYLEGIGLTAVEFLARTKHLGRRSYFIRTMPSYAARLAMQLIQDGHELSARPSVVISHAETLTPADVETVQRAFRCPVVNEYSTWEVPQLARSCPDNPDLLHVNSERAIVRVVLDDGRDAAPGQAGRVVVTDLANYVMPFVNYDLGDRAVVGQPCHCGRGFPTLRGIDGRSTESIRTPDGRLISPSILGHLLVSGCGVIPYVWEYQAVQTAPRAIVLRVVPTERFTPQFAREVESRLEAFLGSSLGVKVETVERIPLEPSGKRLIIKSELPPA
jgi:phenylacetate-coenzyme A ligase PaaK-like adenylate-forming protein